MIRPRRRTTDRKGKRRMQTTQLGEMEQRFADLIWERAPVGSGELVRLCEERFGWKKSTTYTMLKRLCQRGLFENAGGEVRALMSREDFLGMQGEVFLQQSFGGSLPHFFAAFTRRNRLSEEEIRALRQMIDQYDDKTQG